MPAARLRNAGNVRLGCGLRCREKNATAEGFGELAATGPSRPKCPLSLLMSSP